MSAFLQTTVARHRQLAPNIYAIDLVAADGGALPSFEAGAHVEVRVTADLLRPYSLCNDPADRSCYRIGVLRDPHSRGASATICERWSVGDRVAISPPRNLFPLIENATRSVLIGGGIGVTPLMAMAHRLKRLNRNFTFHYCVREPSRAAFLRDIGAMGNLRTHFSAERRFELARDVGAPQDGTHLYVCGPQGFMDQVIECARNFGWADAQIHFEYFDVEVDRAGGAFDVRLASGPTFQVPAGRSIAALLMERGFDVEISCEKGICGSCITRVLAGVPDHRDHYLTDDEKQRGDCIAVCCSRALTPFLTLDL